MKHHIIHHHIANTAQQLPDVHHWWQNPICEFIFHWVGVIFGPINHVLANPDIGPWILIPILLIGVVKGPRAVSFILFGWIFFILSWTIHFTKMFISTGRRNGARRRLAKTNPNYIYNSNR